jgi:hypothetical protein
LQFPAVLTDLKSAIQNPDPKIMENHGKSWENDAKSWKMMENHGKSWNMMENHGR